MSSRTGFLFGFPKQLLDSPNIVHFRAYGGGTEKKSGDFRERGDPMNEEAKPVSATRLVLAQVMTPPDANIAGNVLLYDGGG